MTDTARTSDEVEAMDDIDQLAWELVRVAVQELDQCLQGLDPTITINPARDRVLVTLLPEEFVSKAGLVLTVGDKAPWRAMVLAVGPQANRQGGPGPCDHLLQRGDIVVMDAVTGHYVPHPAADDAKLDLRLVQRADILAVMTEGTDEV